MTLASASLRGSLICQLVCFDSCLGDGGARHPTSPSRGIIPELTPFSRVCRQGRCRWPCAVLSFSLIDVTEVLSKVRSSRFVDGRLLPRLWVLREAVCRCVNPCCSQLETQAVAQRSCLFIGSSEMGSRTSSHGEILAGGSLGLVA